MTYKQNKKKIPQKLGEKTSKRRKEGVEGRNPKQISSKNSATSEEDRRRQENNAVPHLRNNASYLSVFPIV